MINIPTDFQFDDERYDDSSFFAIKHEPAWTGLPDLNFHDQQSCFDDDSFMDNSFEELSNEHPQAIQQAFINLKENAQIDREHDNFGLHDLELKDYHKSSSMEHKTVKSVVLESNLISQKNKKRFLDDLKKDTILSQTIKGLIPIFDDQTLNEVVFLIQQVWEKYLEFQKQFVIKQPILPMFKRIYDFDSFESLQDHPQEVARFNIPRDRLLRQANQLGDKMQEVMYYDSRIKMLNLRSCFQKIKNQRELIKSFGKFLKVLFKAVFLSAEGEFEHPEEQEENPFKRTHASRFISSFSQDQQENDSEDEYTSIRCAPLKKRKAI